MPTTWYGLDPRFGPDSLGFLPDILLDSDPRPVKEQLDDRYSHGGGWRPIKGFKRNAKSGLMHFPGDQAIYHPTAFTHIHGETVVFYSMCSLLCVIQADGKWEVTRVD